MLNFFDVADGTDNQPQKLPPMIKPLLLVLPYTDLKSSRPNTNNSTFIKASGNRTSRSIRLKPTPVQKHPVRHSNTGESTHTGNSHTINNGIDIQVTGRGGLFCPKHGSYFNSHCSCGYRKMCSYRLSMDGPCRDNETKLDKQQLFVL